MLDYIYYVSGCASGLVAAAIYWRSRLADQEAQLGSLANVLRAERDYYRSEANINATELQRHRAAELAKVSFSG